MDIAFYHFKLFLFSIQAKNTYKFSLLNLYVFIFTGSIDTRIIRAKNLRWRTALNHIFLFFLMRWKNLYFIKTIKSSMKI